jgi:hypothetical protein
LFWRADMSLSRTGREIFLPPGAAGEERSFNGGIAGPNLMIQWK